MTEQPESGAGALPVAAEQLRTVVDAVAEGMVVIGADGLIALANAAASRIIGRPAAELQGMPVPLPAQVWREDGRPWPEDDLPIVVARRTGAHMGRHLMGVDLGAGIRWFEVSAQPLDASAAGPPFAVVTTFADVTDRVQAEQALRVSEERFRLLIDAMSERVLVFGPDGRIEMVNPAAARQGTLPAEAMVGADPRHIVERLDEDGVPFAPGTEPTARARRGERISDMLVQVGWPGRPRHWLKLACCPLGPGPPHRVLVTAADVTDRVEAERALRESERRYRLLAEYSGDLVTRHDLDTTIRYASPAAEAVLGWRAEDLVGMRGVDLMHPDDRAAFEAAGPALMAGTRTEPLRVRLRDPAGRYRWVEATFRLAPAPGGGPDEVVAVTRDVRAQVAAEQALADSEARFRLVAEHSSDVIARVGPGGRLLWVSPACERVLGYRPEEVEGSMGVDLVHPDDRAGVPLSTGRRVQPGEVSHARIRHRDGRWVWTDVTYNPLYDAGGELIEAHVSLRDVTVRVEAEDAERRRVREREELMALAGHELRAPLGALEGLLWLVDEDPGVRGEQAHRRLASARARLAILRRLASDLVIMTQLDTQAMRLWPRDADLAELARDLVASAELEAGRGGVRIEVHTRATPVHVDPQRIGQVIDNLLSNAIKFSPPGGVVRVHASGDFRVARVVVDDQGPGVPPAERERVFGRFVRGPGLESVPGSGLGLPMARAIAEAHGGGVRLDDAPGGGLRAVLELPRE